MPRNADGGWGWRRILLALPLALAVLIVALVLLLDARAFAWFGDCGSENMSAVQAELHRYRDAHGGALPASEAELVAELTRAGRPDVFRCLPTRRSYVWRPGLRDDHGHEVVVMCPPRSHGGIWKHSLALLESGTKVGYGVVRGSRVEHR